jgi:hypothetical protein
MQNMMFQDIMINMNWVELQYYHYPFFVDVDRAKQLPPVALENDRAQQWLFAVRNGQLF